VLCDRKRNVAMIKRGNLLDTLRKGPQCIRDGRRLSLLGVMCARR
jgi:hypothetical protein